MILSDPLVTSEDAIEPDTSASTRATDLEDDEELTFAMVDNTRWCETFIPRET